MITWRDEGHRIVAMCAAAPVGAVFPSAGRRTRWRAWVTKNMNPSEGTETDLASAKREVEQRFAAFLALAELQPTPAKPPHPRQDRGGPTEGDPDRPYCKPDQSCCDFCCGN